MGEKSGMQMSGKDMKGAKIKEKATRRKLQEEDSKLAKKRKQEEKDAELSE